MVCWLKLSAENDLCGLRNTAFQPGESITYNIFYAVAGIYVNAGTASFSSTLERLNNTPVYHILAQGTSNSSYDWIFKVRDKYETYFDTGSLQPLKFVRNIDEGGYKKYENVTFNHQTNTAITTEGVYKVPGCIQDVISAVYYMRNIDFNKYNVGDKIPFKMFLDNEVYDLYIRYQGKETVKTKYGKFRAIKFKPLLLKGTLFQGGEKMNCWVTDDPNHIPLRIETPIVVGSIKVDMMQYRNLRHPMSSLISW
ncbi:Protein of unknown function [Filimonas lacunae]|uniref:DUF3108 domain-containing protein n=1 Tax=Filimonas lacunae TaxID=477680 RepID=A0A173MNC4_9BACT|nr:DUF3108 domain-containing protein [Filimonas lacunae]BAV09143.1 ATP-dependent exoDNAse (exonuclease V) alpha subunit - helicase superfamily I member [Filimonas lacunae]SIS67912.1 Protein of unknown function [Filimonas lacunae]